MNISRSRRYAAPLVILGIALVVGGTRTAPDGRPRLARSRSTGARTSPRPSRPINLRSSSTCRAFSGRCRSPVARPRPSPSLCSNRPGRTMRPAAVSSLSRHTPAARSTSGRWIRRPQPAAAHVRHQDDREPRVSPDGSKIAYSSDNAVFGSNYTVRVLDLATRTSTTVASDATLDDFEPTWSPDGKTIAFVNGTGANGTSIQAVPAAGGARTALVTVQSPSASTRPPTLPEAARSLTCCSPSTATSTKASSG